MAQPTLYNEMLMRAIDAEVWGSGDPYGEAMAIVAHTLELALVATGGMNEGEAKIVETLALTLVARDPHSRIKGVPQ